MHTVGSGYLYDIAYDDGDKDSRLKPSVIEKVEDSDVTERPSVHKAPEEEQSQDAKFKEGDRVEARFRGDPRKKLYSKWLKGYRSQRKCSPLRSPGSEGTIARVHKNRSKEGSQEYVYDIDYDDGDKDKRIQEEMIKKLPSSGSSQADSAQKVSSTYEEGDAVRVKQKDKGKSVLKSKLHRGNGLRSHVIAWSGFCRSKDRQST